MMRKQSIDGRNQFAMITIEEVYKFILGFKRYKQKKWLRNIVEA